ncbi:hypothetical protein QE152_g36675 [Popillia japonica]|uniref:Uncharacterized protein n=1 Tax=Popillia japonica TaxID=7064 RepID=A0AAW1ICK9_POPJA
MFRRESYHTTSAERSGIITNSPYKEMLKEERETKRPLSGKYVSKKGTTFVCGRDVSKKAKKDKSKNLIPPCRPIEEETIRSLCLGSHEQDCMQCENCEA